MRIASSTPDPEVPSEKINGETLVISSVVNSGDAGALSTYGVSPDHFVGYPQEFNWLLDQVQTHGAVPSRDAFRGRWPKFPLNTHDDVRMAVDQLMEHYYKRTGREILLNATSTLDMGLLDETKELMDQWRPQRTSAKPVSIVSDASFMDRWDDELGAGIPLPYDPFQKATGGIRPGNYGVIAARTNQGKTSHALNIVTHAVTLGHNVLYYSLEMTEHEMRAKLHAGLARRLGFTNITARAILDRAVNREEYKTFLEAVGDQTEWGELHVHTPRHGVVTPQVVHSRLGDYDLGVVDLITLMANRKGEQSINDWRIAASISNDLKQIALEVNTATWVTAQINRQGDVGDAPPKMGNLAQTDSLAQDADLVITMRARGKDTVTALSLEKNRHGYKTQCYTTFKPNIGEFKVISKEQAEEMVIEAEVA